MAPNTTSSSSSTSATARKGGNSKAKVSNEEFLVTCIKNSIEKFAVDWEKVATDTGLSPRGAQYVFFWILSLSHRFCLHPHQICTKS